AHPDTPPAFLHSVRGSQYPPGLPFRVVDRSFLAYNFLVLPQSYINAPDCLQDWLFWDFICIAPVQKVETANLAVSRTPPYAKSCCFYQVLLRRVSVPNQVMLRLNSVQSAPPCRSPDRRNSRPDQGYEGIRRSGDRSQRRVFCT